MGVLSYNPDPDGARAGKASPVQWVIAGALVLCAVALAAAGCMPDVHFTIHQEDTQNQSSASQILVYVGTPYVQRQSGILHTYLFDPVTGQILQPTGIHTCG